MSVNGVEYAWEAIRERKEWTVVQEDYSRTFWSRPERRLIEGEILGYLGGG